MQAILMNSCFQAVFPNEGNFEDSEQKEPIANLDMIKVTTKKITKIMENLHVRKFMGLDNISYWVLRECKDYLAEKIYSRNSTCVGSISTALQFVG